METQNENRLKIWRALSELFLDTEINDVTFDYIARTVLEIGYTPREMHGILWGEVFPVLECNLRGVAGVWAGWPDDWLLNNLKVSKDIPAIQGDASTIRIIKDYWTKVATRLPAEYA